MSTTTPETDGAPPNPPNKASFCNVHAYISSISLKFFTTVVALTVWISLLRYEINVNQLVPLTGNFAVETIWIRKDKISIWKALIHTACSWSLTNVLNCNGYHHVIGRMMLLQRSPKQAKMLPLQTWVQLLLQKSPRKPKLRQQKPKHRRSVVITSRIFKRQKSQIADTNLPCLWM